MERAEVIVVGGGLAGASVAWWLSAHADVLLLEQGEELGAEASAQNAGMVRRLVRDPVELALAHRSASRMAAPGPDWGAPPSRVTGAVIATGGPGEALAASAAALAALGVRIELSDQLPPAMVGSPVQRAWVMPDERIADAHMLVQGFLRGARRRGGRVARSRRVTGVAVEAGRAVGVETALGPVAADRVVLATGAWSRRFAATHGLQRPLTPMARHLLTSDPHPLSHPGHPWCWVDDAGVYVRPEAGGWMTSPCDEAPLDPSPGPGSAGPVAAEGRALAAEKLSRWFPALGPLRLARGWTGLRTFAPDRRPYLGPDPDIEGVWWASGLGGSGVTCCFSAGELVAELMLGRAPDWIDPAAVAPGRAF